MRPASPNDGIIAGYAALGVVIHVLEAGLPSPVPGIKPGLANVITLIVLLRFGWSMAAWVAGLRILVGSIFIGSFLTPTFVLSLSGGVATILALGIADRWNRAHPDAALTAIGLAAIAAVSHMTTQFCAAYLLFVPHPGLWALLPVLLTAALLFGVVTGYLANHVLDRLAPPGLRTPAADRTMDSLPDRP